MLATLVSFAQIYAIGSEMKRIPDKIKSAINIYRIQLIMMYLAIIIAVAPDAVYLWTYGEVSTVATQRLLLTDRLFDSLFLIPFFIFTYLQIRCGPILKFQLIRRPSPIDLSVTKPKVKSTLLCALAILLMSVLVTISK
jgi:hypothetical protein